MTGADKVVESNRGRLPVKTNIDISHMDLLVTITGKLSSIVGTTADVVKVGFAITTPL